MSYVHGLPYRMAVMALLVAASSLLLASTAPTTSSMMAHLDAATATCIRRAGGAKRLCKLQDSSAACRAKFQRDIAACFSSGPGVACATACLVDQRSCQVHALPDVTTCRQAHRKHDDDVARAACAVPLDDCKRSFAECLPACAQG